MTNKVCKIFSVILACVSTMPGDAAVKTNNASRSYAGAYQQVNALQAQQEYWNSTASVAAQLPVTVDDENLANSIANNESGAPNMSELEACAMIYPNGKFKWGVPEYGIQKEPQCLAIVELREVNSGTVLAYTTVAAGQSIKCNIDSFPVSSFNSNTYRIELPADEAPTMEDVIAVMNEEQKQNAGLKIAAGAIIAGAAGNLLSPKTAGESDGKIPLGTGKSQLIGTAIGAAAGAGIMAASSYSGKVAGDTIKSTAVNAASGMLIGNMLAGANGGDSVITTTKCAIGDSKDEYDCIAGKYQEYDDKPFPSDEKKAKGFYIIKKDKSDLRFCENDGSNFVCNYESHDIDEIIVAAAENSGQDSIPWQDITKKKNNLKIEYWRHEEGDPKDVFKKDPDEANDSYYKIKSAKKVKESKKAYAVFENTKLNKPLGYTMDDWDKTLSTKNPEIRVRYSGGQTGDVIKDAKVADFKPSMRGADDDVLIDLSNQARTKGTIVGATVGGAGGGLAGYAGAKNEVTERWLAARREYEGTLSNFWCFTGARPLAAYNDYAEIPALKKTDN